MPVTITQLATRYGVCQRTILRWKSQGVNVVDCLAVAKHVGCNNRTPLAVLQTVTDALSLAHEQSINLNP